MKKRSIRTHIDDVFAALETNGLNQVHSAMAQNIIEFRVRGEMPYHNYHKDDLLERIRQVTPGMVEQVNRVFKNLGK